MVAISSAQFVQKHENDIIHVNWNWFWKVIFDDCERKK